MSYKNIIKMATEFERLASEPQLYEVLPGDIADAFPQFFPTKHQENNGQKSPFFNNLDQFMSGVIPGDVNAKIVFFVRPGWTVAPQISFSKGGRPISNPKWISSITAFVQNQTKNLPTLAAEKLKGKALKNALQVATYVI